MAELLEACFSGVNVVPTSLLGLTMVYWLFVLTGAIGLDVFDFDLDLDIDADVDVDVDIDADLDVPSGQIGSMMSLGVVVLRFLNVGSVPVMLWFSIFSLALWTFTMILDDPAYHENTAQDLLVLVRNGFFALITAKALTQPLRGKFDPVEPTKPQDLIGRTCAITTTEVTETFGQARHEMDAAPLLLNVRSTDTSLTKGDLAVIVGFDSGQQTYSVEKADREVEQ